MPTVDHAPQRPRAPFSDPEDVAAFVETLGRYERGEIGPDAWRAFHLLRGLYPQRDGERHMFRIKAPEGALTAAQLEAIADVASRHSRGFGHVTTRQDVQLHFVALADVPAVMARLADAGITTREACGNSMRNVTTCALAGVARGERFDPTPYGEALTRHFLRKPIATTLPRKFKIAFEGCAEDHAATAIHDVGFRAVVQDGRRGFRVRVAGGTSTVPTSAEVLYDFLPVAETLTVTEGILRVFHAHGDREHRERARMKFVVRRLGWPAFRDLVLASIEVVRAEGGIPLPFDPERPPEERAPDWSRPPPPAADEIARRLAAEPIRGPGIVPQPSPPSPFAAWRATNARAQKQAGYVAASVTLPLGDVTSAQLRVLADLARALGDGQVRLSDDQGLLLRWIREADLPALHAALAAAGLGLDGAHGVADPVTCPGAETCRLAVTQSRGLGKLLFDHVRASPRLRALAPELSLKISGCPNGCGRHHVAGIGFQGSLRKVAGEAIPQYFVLVGGGSSDAGARFGRLAAKVPARRVPAAVDALLGLYERERADGESASDFLARVDLAQARAALAGLAEITAEQVTAADRDDLVGPVSPQPADHQR